MIKSGKSIGIILPGTETKEINYEQVRDAIEIFDGYYNTLKRLGHNPPAHIRITLKILSFIEPMYSEFKPKGG